MWKRIIEGLLLIIVGYALALVIQKPEELINKKGKMRAIAIQESYFENFRHTLDCYHADLVQNNRDNELGLCQQMQSLCQQCADMRFSILVHDVNKDLLTLLSKNVESFLSELDQPNYMEDSKIVLSSIESKQYSTSEKLNQLYSIENIIIYCYLSHIYQNSIIFSYAELLNIAESDTIQLGEQYVSKLIFSVQDITGNKNFYRILNENTLQFIDIENSEFREIPTKKGCYHHDILLMCSGFYRGSGCKVPIDYYVK